MDAIRSKRSIRSSGSNRPPCRLRQESLPYRPIDLSLAPVKQPQQARLAIKPFEREFLTDAVAAMNLNRRVRGLESHLRGPFLSQCRRSEEWQLVVCSPRGFESQPRAAL